MKFFRPSAEALEGRALLTAKNFDSLFGTGSVVLGSVVTNAQIAPNGSTATSATVALPAGGIITAEPYSIAASQTSTFTPVGIAIRKYDAFGNLDSTFGTAGQTIVPIPSGYNTIKTSPTNLVIGGDGSIALAATVGTQFDGAGTSAGIVVRLTSNGQLDTTFGANQTGEVVLNSPVNTIAVQPTDGKLVVAGGLPIGPNGVGQPFTVARLTTGGALDTTFNGTGTQTLLLLPYETNAIARRIFVDPNGQIDLIAHADDNQVNYFYPHVVDALAQFNPDGSLNTSVGSNGIVTLGSIAGSSLKLSVVDAGMQSNGDLIVAGYTQLSTSSPPVTTLIRLRTNGTLDPTFAGNGSGTTTIGRAGDQVSALTIGTFGTKDAIYLAGTSDRRFTAASGTVISVQLFVEKLDANGTLDPSFGSGGRISTVLGPNTTYQTPPQNINVDLGGSVILAFNPQTNTATSTSYSYQTQTELAAFLPTRFTLAPNDYEGGGISDPAALLPAYGAFAYRRSTGGDVIQPFGIPGAGNEIPAPGDYDGDGKTDVAAYLPNLGILAYRPSSGGPDVYVRFGPTGQGQAIPVPGDYDGDGRTDVAFYLPGPGLFIVKPSDGATPYQDAFGSAGSGQSIPVPGDYDGDGKTDLAVYLPNQAIWAIRYSTNLPSRAIPFGQPGAGNTIPAPGDYDGDGVTNVAGYLPAYGVFAYRSVYGVNEQDVQQPFGVAGAGNTIPVPGDYDGDLQSDLAVYLPQYGALVYRSTSGLGDVVESFGAPGSGQTLPATVGVPLDFGTVSTMSINAAMSDPNAGVVVYLPDDLSKPTPARKPLA